MTSNKLGRPYVSGSPRKETLKFYVSIDELNDFISLENNLIYFYSKHGFVYNRSVHFRQFLKHCDNPIILGILFDDLPSHELKKTLVCVVARLPKKNKV